MKIELKLFTDFPMVVASMYAPIITVAVHDENTDDSVTIKMSLESARYLCKELVKAITDLDINDFPKERIEEYKGEQYEAPASW